MDQPPDTSVRGFTKELQHTYIDMLITHVYDHRPKRIGHPVLSAIHKLTCSLKNISIMPIGIALAARTVSQGVRRPSSLITHSHVGAGDSHSYGNEDENEK